MIEMCCIFTVVYKSMYDQHRSHRSPVLGLDSRLHDGDDLCLNLATQGVVCSARGDISQDPRRATDFLFLLRGCQDILTI